MPSTTPTSPRVTRSAREWPSTWSQLLLSTTFRDKHHGDNTKRFLTFKRMYAGQCGAGFKYRYFQRGPRAHAASRHWLQSACLRFHEWRERRQQHVRLVGPVLGVFECPWSGGSGDPSGESAASVACKWWLLRFPSEHAGDADSLQSGKTRSALQQRSTRRTID